MRVRRRDIPEEAMHAPSWRPAKSKFCFPVPIASRAARDGLDPSTLAGRAPVDGSASAAATGAA